MTDAIPLVRKLQSDALDLNVPVVNLLRMAKVIATKLDLKDALIWIDRELDGYMDLKTDELPQYRRLTGQPKGWSAYVSWQVINFEDPEHARLFSRAPLGLALGPLETGLTGKDGTGQYTFPYTPEVKAMLMKSLDGLTDAAIFLDDSQLWNIINSVRNLILNWSLELEKAGILGEGMTFTAQEKREAGPVTKQYFIQNAGVVGDVSGQANVTNKQTAIVALDLSQVRDFVAQAKGVLSSLPAEARAKVESALTETDKEINAVAPNQGRVRALLTSVKTACEGAAGNIAAEGIMKLLGSIF